MIDAIIGYILETPYRFIFTVLMAPVVLWAFLEWVERRLDELAQAVHSLHAQARIWTRRIARQALLLWALVKAPDLRGGKKLAK